MSTGTGDIAALGQRLADIVVARLQTVLEALGQRLADIVVARLQTVLEAVPDATIAVAADGRILLANALAEDLFGYARDELTGRPVEILVPETFRAAHAGHRQTYAAARSKRPMGSGLELAGLHRNGTEFPVEISLAPVVTDDGPVVLAAIRDTTDRRRIQQALEAKNFELELAISAKDRFLAGMSHELRTPLNAILGFTGTLLMGLAGPLNDDQSGQLDTVRTSARHLLAIINDLLDLAKIESGKVELALADVDCRAVVEEVRTTLGPLAAAKGLAFEVDVPDEPVVAFADRRALHQILLNLTNNAIKFTDSGTVRVVLDGPGGDGHPGPVRIAVADTGIGISPADQERLFDAFEQVGTAGGDREGTGLGLHISRRLAELLGATIGCTSTPGQGSTFAVELRGR